MRRPSSFALAVLFAFAGCDGETVPPPADTTPPASLARALFSAGGDAVLGPTPLVTSVSQLRVRFEADEPVTFYYSTDGSEPARGAPNTTTGGLNATLTLTQDTTLRWFTIDLAGNVEAPHHAEIRFDRQGPTLTVSPPPGAFEGPVTVEVTADEPATLFYTVDGSSPLPGNPGTEERALPVDFEVLSSTLLRFVARDTAGNLSEPVAARYDIDTLAPVSRAWPTGGRYLGPVTVRLLVDDAAARLHYTTDGGTPTEASPLYVDPILLDGDTTLRFRAVDAGGNLEAVRTETYRVGPRTARAPQVGADATLFPVAGGLWLAGALMDGAGVLAGRPEASTLGDDWAAWSAGRTTIDGYTLQAGGGPHALHAPGPVADAAAGAGPGDLDGDGSAVDDAWDARVAALTERAAGGLPARFYPTALFYLAARSSLLAAPLGDDTADGRPAWDDDYGRIRWQGARAVDRVTTPDTLAGGLRALAARARTGTLVQHPTGDDQWSTAVAPVLALRCGGCHRDGGVRPELGTRADLQRAGLLAPGPLAGLLAGLTEHPVDPAPAAQVQQIEAWLADGAPGDALATAPGPSGREGALALLALDLAAAALSYAVEALAVDPTTEALGALTEGGYVAARVAVVEGPDPMGLPRRVDQLRLDSALFETGPQAWLLRAAVELFRLSQTRRALFTEGPLAGSDAWPSGPLLAERVLRATAAALADRAWDADAGAFAASWSPRSGRAARVDTAAHADAMVALRRAAMDGPTNLDADALLPLATVYLTEQLRGPDGDFLPGGALGEPADLAMPLLSTQLAALEALALEAQAGNNPARQAAEILWARLEAIWWDDAVGAWQTTLGDPVYVYGPALAARVVDALGAAEAAGIAPLIGARRARFHDRWIRDGLRAAETWLTGELGEGEDADGDGVPKPGRGDHAAAAVFLREIRP